MDYELATAMAIEASLEFPYDGGAEGGLTPRILIRALLILVISDSSARRCEKKVSIWIRRDVIPIFKNGGVTHSGAIEVS